MLDTPENRRRFIKKSQAKLRRNWKKAWFATAEKDGIKHFVVHGLTLEGRDTHFNSSGVPGPDCGEPGKTYSAGAKELKAAGFHTDNFDGIDPSNEITL